MKATPMTLDEIQDEIIEDFRRFRDGMEKYEYIIALGREHPGMDDRWKTDEHSVPGCQATVWLRSERWDGRLHFWADSDSLINKGILALLLRVLNDQPPREDPGCQPARASSQQRKDWGSFVETHDSWLTSGRKQEAGDGFPPPCAIVSRRLRAIGFYGDPAADGPLFAPAVDGRRNPAEQYQTHTGSLC
ncbi:MAG: SufE family protein [Acidobacteriota bacterium]